MWWSSLALSAPYVCIICIYLVFFRHVNFGQTPRTLRVDPRTRVVLCQQYGDQMTKPSQHEARKRVLEAGAWPAIPE